MFGKIKIVLGLVLSAMVLAGTVSAQKVQLRKGDIAPLKSEKQINIAYDYSEFGVGKFKTEAEYVETKKTEYNKDEPGKGDKWHDGWVSARATRYQPKFEELINKYTEKKGMTFGNFPDAKYTLTVKTTFVEPGFNVGVMKRPASVNFTYIFHETANPSNVIAEYTHVGVPGSQFGGYDFDVGSRVAESYAKGGKMLGGVIAK